MNRSAAIAATVVLAVVVGGVAGGTHANDVHADTQVVGDGVVVVEEVFPLDRVFLVVHVVEDGERGAVVGERTVGSGQHNAVEVPVDTDAFDGPTRLRAVLYRDADTDGQFTRGEDVPVESVGRVVASNFTVVERDRSVRVVADASFDPQETRGSVTVPLVEAARDGYVVIATDADGRPERILAAAPVVAGRNPEVTVDLPDSLFAGEGDTRVLWAVVYADDGDGRFDPAADDPVLVDGRPVASELPVEVNASAVNVTTTSAPGNATSSTTTAATVVEETTTDRSTTEDTTPTTGSADPATTTGTTTQTPGFDRLAAGTAVALSLLVLAVRRRLG